LNPGFVREHNLNWAIRAEKRTSNKGNLLISTFDEPQTVANRHKELDHQNLQQAWLVLPQKHCKMHSCIACQTVLPLNSPKLLGGAAESVSVSEKKRETIFGQAVLHSRCHIALRIELLRQPSGTGFLFFLCRAKNEGKQGPCTDIFWISGSALITG
jgi:hypothetical protein